jgi:hypothetical protein
MKSYKLSYTPEPRDRRFLFTNIDLKELSTPLTLSRENPPQEEVVFNTRKKSEQVEYESEEYRRLKEKESNPLVLEDGDNRIFTGKLQDLGKNNHCYFAFINTGSVLKIVPIKKWYRFTQKHQFDVINTAEVETKMQEAGTVGEESAEEEKEEIDYDEVFDDDDGEEVSLKAPKEKKLTSAGKELKNLMKSYEVQEESTKEDPRAPAAGRRHRAAGASEVLTREGIREFFRGEKTSLKGLLRSIKAQYELKEAEKSLIKEFIGEYCDFETDTGSGEKILVLRR